MRVRIVLAAEVVGSATELRSTAALGAIAREGLRQNLQDAGGQTVRVDVEVHELPEATAVECAHCGGPVPLPSRVGGRKRRFCSDACRMAAHRRRVQGLPEQLERLSTARGGRLARALTALVETARSVPKGPV